MAAEQGEETAVVFEVGNELAGEIQKVMLEEADDVKAVCDDAGVGEVAAHEGAVGTREVDADDTHFFTAFERGQKVPQVGLTTTGNNIEDAMVAQVTECGGKGHIAMDAVFVDA